MDIAWVYERSDFMFGFCMVEEGNGWEGELCLNNVNKILCKNLEMYFY